MEQKAIQLGAVLLTLAFLLRLAGTRGNEEIGRTLLFLSSGRMVTQTADPAPDPEENREEEPADPAAAIPVFGENQETLVQVNAPWPVDTLDLLRQPLEWDLAGEEPTVVILHSHATESYEKEAGYEETSPYRTLDTNYNMVSVGERVAQLLEAGGIRVIHDRTLHDYPSYNGSYNHARASIAEYLKKYPSIRLVLDLHRDASGDVNNQLRTQATVNGTPSAQLMLVIGTGESGLKHEHWQDNLALGLKLHAQLESIAPGITRPLMLRTQRFNQDLSPGALLIEVGAAGNTHPEALAAAEVLAAAIADLALGANSG